MSLAMIVKSEHNMVSLNTSVTLYRLARVWILGRPVLLRLWKLSLNLRNFFMTAFLSISWTSCIFWSLPEKSFLLDSGSLRTEDGQAWLGVDVVGIFSTLFPLLFLNLNSFLSGWVFRGFLKTKSNTGALAGTVGEDLTEDGGALG